MLYLMEPITLGTSYYTCAFRKRPTLATLVFKLWEGSCTGSLNNRPVWQVCLRTKSERLCLSLSMRHWKNKALQGVFLVNLRLIKWIIWIQCWEIELFVTDFAIFTGTGCWNISNCIFNCFYRIMNAKCFLELVCFSNHTRFIFIMKFLFTGCYKTTLHSFRPEYFQMSLSYKHCNFQFFLLLLMIKAKSLHMCEKWKTGAKAN